MLTPLVLASLLQVPAPTQELSPGTVYAPAVPTLERTVGHDFRSEVTGPEDIVRYMEALVAAAPQRTRLIPYGETWEGRPLYMILSGSQARIAALPEILAGLQALADPRGLTPAEAERLIGELPVVTALVHGIHGNEISSSGAAMAEASWDSTGLDLT
jgi:hypothetical protein